MKMLTRDEMLDKFSRVKGLAPLGHFALVQVLPAQEKSEGGIVTSWGEDLKREQKGMDIGVVLGFGHTAYEGFSQCKSPKDWGVEVGDVVELNSRYNHKIPRLSQYNEDLQNLRIVTDEEIIAKGVE